jgi:branched-chain amino acid aminotransferase/4-amino-4-deoxychorismate lyase
MAGTMKQQWQVDDVVLFDEEGHIAECLNSNIFWIKENTIFTPSLETGCIEGIMRKQIFKALEKHRINWMEGKYKEDQLLTADFAFTSNATGMVPFLSIENKTYSSSNTLFDLIRGEFAIIF